jgi:hypothetical protein
MGDEVVVFDDVNIETGKRALFVKRAGSPVDLGKWMESVPAEVRPLTVFDQFEMDQGRHMVWHCLRMDWPLREMFALEADSAKLQIDGWKPAVFLDGRASVPACGWTLIPGSGERLSGAMRSAAELYWSVTNRWPSLALVRSLPGGAPDTLQVGDGCTLRIIPADWVWRGVVVVL